MWLLFVKGESKAQRILGLTLIAVGVCGLIVNHLITREKEREVATEGTVRERYPYEPEEVVVYLGSERFIYDASKIREGIVIKPFDRISLSQEMKITKSEKGLLLSTTIRSADDRIIATVVDNDWAVNPHNYFRRNYDDSAVEVIDDYGTPVLQLELCDLGTLRICGIFVSDTCHSIVTERGAVFSKNKLTEPNTRKVLTERNLKIEPWFIHGKNSLGKRTPYGKELLERYKEAVSLRYSMASEYLALSNKDLQNEALSLAEQLKDSLKKELDKFHKGKTDCSNKMYEQNIRARAIALRSEMLYRLPKGLGPLKGFSDYIDPIHIVHILEVVADLENLALNLTERRSFATLGDKAVYSILFPDPAERNRTDRDRSASEEQVNDFLSRAKCREGVDYRLLNKTYPEGYVLFLVGNRTTTLVNIPDTSLLRSDHYIDWDKLRIDKVTDEGIRISICDFNMANYHMGGIISLNLEKSHTQPTLQLRTCRLTVVTEIISDNIESCLFVLGFRRSKLVGSGVTLYGSNITMDCDLILGGRKVNGIAPHKGIVLKGKIQLEPGSQNGVDVK